MATLESAIEDVFIDRDDRARWAHILAALKSAAQKRANGLTGDAVPPSIHNGATMSMNS